MWWANQGKWPHLSQCDFPSPAKDGLVVLLIGVDNADLHYSFANVRGWTGEPVARLGQLGWTCIGCPDSREESGSKVSHRRNIVIAGGRTGMGGWCLLWVVSDIKEVLGGWELWDWSQRLHCMYWWRESSPSESQQLCALQWSQIPYCRTMEGTEATIAKQPSDGCILSSQHQAKPKEERVCWKGIPGNYRSICEGYLRKVPRTEDSPPEVWYLPHFPIVRMNKSTTKVSIVSDCSAKFNGISLNDVIIVGPKLQRELFDVLLGSRRNPVALVCNIKEMYLQIEIEPKDRPLFRILWRDNRTDQDPEEYEFSRVVFGKNSAPMVAQFIAQENARRHKTTYPVGCRHHAQVHLLGWLAWQCRGWRHGCQSVPPT